MNGQPVSIRERSHCDASTEPRLGALLEETDAALAECLARLERVRAAGVPDDFRAELVFIQDMLKAARVDLTASSLRPGLKPSSNRAG